MKSNSPKTENPVSSPVAVQEEAKLDMLAPPVNGDVVDAEVASLPVVEEPGNGHVQRADPVKPAAPDSAESSRTRDGKHDSQSRAAGTGYRIPRRSKQVLAGHRLCPTVPGESPALVQQTIQTATCAERQQDGYHKCYGCVHSSGTHYSGNGLPPLDNSPSTARAFVRPESPRSPRR